MKSNYTHSLYSKGGLLNPRCRKVNQYDLNGNFIKQWGSIKSINLETGYSRAYIWSCCNGRHKKAYNFIWKYAD